MNKNVTYDAVAQTNWTIGVNIILPSSVWGKNMDNKHQIGHNKPKAIPRAKRNKPGIQR